MFLNKIARRAAIWGSIIGLNVMLFMWISSQGEFGPMYQENCSDCHGGKLTGGALGPPLVGTDLNHGDSVAEMTRIIKEGATEQGMPSFEAALTDSEIQSLAIYIGEQRAGLSDIDLKTDAPMVMPTEPVASERHRFRLETVATGLDPLPFSIAPLPDGRLLLTERGRGLSIVGKDGERTGLVPGAPTGHSGTYGSLFVGLKVGLGWMMDVALHPDYANNGWVYLQYGDRCGQCNTVSRQSGKDVAMNKLVRGRIENGRWVDQETIWQADMEAYTRTVDMGAGGRTAFDNAGHVFISVGIKGPTNYSGVQDLSTPWGKIHRAHDDGGTPHDNPFVDTPNALASIWTYGHRSPQGLEYRTLTAELWGTEMGPRGGDEVNRLLPGRNYGWPLTSKGLNYDGTPVEYGRLLGLSVEGMDIEQPVVDLTPSPAVSSFIIYTGSAFPGWHQDIIVGTLKARALYRMVMKDGKLEHQETLLDGLARIRDVEADNEGRIYLLLEHARGSLIVRLVPVT